MEYSINFTVNQHLKLFKKYNLFKFIPELEEEIKNYSSVLKNASIVPSHLTLDQRFHIPIEMMDNDHYDMIWQITSDILLRERTGIPVDKSLWYSSPDELEPGKVIRFTESRIEEPIIIALYRPINRGLIIDGNHRFQAA